MHRTQSKTQPDRAMRKEDNSPQGKIVTELLQHLHACKNNCDVFYGRQLSSPPCQSWSSSSCLSRLSSSCQSSSFRHSHRDHHHDRYLNACKNSCTFFCAREDELEKMKEYITGPSQKVEKVISEDLEYEGNYLEEKKTNQLQKMI